MAEQIGISLSIRPDGIGDIERRLARVASVTSKPRTLLNRIGAVLESSTKRRFRSGVGPDGVAWKPSIRVKLHGGKTLLDHAHLRDSITHDADDHQVVVGSNLIQARILQLGGIVRPKNAAALVFNIPGIGWRRVAKVSIPARPYLGVSEDDRDNIGDQIERFLKAQLT